MFFHFGLEGNIFRDIEQIIRRAVSLIQRRFDRVHNFDALVRRGNQFLRDIVLAAAFKNLLVRLTQEIRLLLGDIGAVAVAADNILGRHAEEVLALFVPHNIIAVGLFNRQGNRQIVHHVLQEVLGVADFLFLLFLLRNILGNGQHHQRLALGVKHRGFDQVQEQLAPVVGGVFLFGNIQNFLAFEKVALALFVAAAVAGAVFFAGEELLGSLVKEIGLVVGPIGVNGHGGIVQNGLLEVLGFHQFALLFAFVRDVFGNRKHHEGFALFIKHGHLDEVQQKLIPGFGDIFLFGDVYNFAVLEHLAFPVAVEVIFLFIQTFAGEHFQGFAVDEGHHLVNASGVNGQRGIVQNGLLEVLAFHQFALLLFFVCDVVHHGNDELGVALRIRYGHLDHMQQACFAGSGRVRLLCNTQRLARFQHVGFAV